MSMRTTKYWIIVASKDHVATGAAAGIAQACHGKAAPLKRMQKGDAVIFYSGKMKMGKAESCQKFTAIGTVADDEVYPFQMTDSFCAFRRKIEFYDSEEISIKPLIEDLTFIQNKKSWGYPFRFGHFEINLQDFELISSKMLEQAHV